MLLSTFLCLLFFFFFKQKTAYEMRISDWSSDVCSSDLLDEDARNLAARVADRLIDEIEQSLLAAVAGEPDGHRMAAIRLAGHKHAVEQRDEALFGHFGQHLRDGAQIGRAHV